MYKINQWMLAAILIFCGMMVITACSNDDNDSSLTANPSEFCIVTVDLSATSDKEAASAAKFSMRRPA